MGRGITITPNPNPGQTALVTPGHYFYSGTSNVLTKSGGSGQPLVKWHPGNYMLSNNVNGSPPPWTGRHPGSNQVEMNLLKANGTNILGYAAQYDWVFLQPTAKGAYPGFGAIDADYLALQTTVPGSRFCPLVRTYQPQTGINSTNYQNDWTGTNCPAYILNDNTGTYGTYKPNGRQVGFSYMENQGSNTIAGMSYVYSAAARWIAAVSNEYANMFIALGNRQVPDGSGLTYNQHPLIEAIVDWDEFSIGLQQPLFPTDYNGANEQANYISFLGSVANSMQNTLFGTYLSYGNGAASNPTAQLLAILQSLQTVATNGNAFFSNADTVPLFIHNAVVAQGMFTGNVYPQPNPFIGSPTPNTGIDLRPSVVSIATVQGHDYQAGGDFPAYSPQLLQAIGNMAVQNNPASGTVLANGLKASHIFWCCVTGRNLLSTDWPQLIYPVATNQPTNTTPPSNLLGHTVT